MTLQEDHRSGLILLIVFVLLPQNSWAFFPKQEQPSAAAAAEDASGSDFITSKCEKFDGQKCDPVTNECKVVMGVEKCPTPSTPSGRNQCYASWLNTSSGFQFVKKGCWMNGHDCRGQRRCQQRPPVRDIYFCCCEGNMCNQNITFHSQPVNVGPRQSVGQGARVGTTTLLPPVVKDPTQTTKAILYSIVPIVVGTVIIVAVFFLWKRHRRNLYTGHQQLPTIEPGYVTTPSPSSLNLDLIERIEVRARGRFGCVWKAKLVSEIVALKVFPLQDRQSWCTEQEIYSLPQMSHENILRFIACEKRGDNLTTEFWLLTEFHEHGSLYDYLKGHIVSWAQLCKISETMARGLAFLHDEIPATNTLGAKPAVAHRDFKSKNVLLKGDLSACVADFGLAIKFEPGKGPGETHGLVGTRRYMAPEVLEGAICFNRDAFLRIDMYACGLVLWELLTRCNAAEGPVGEYQLPFESAEEVGQHPSLEAMQEYVVTRKKRPPVHEHWKRHPGMASLVSTVEECWDQDAEARLSAGCVQERVATLSRSISIVGFTTPAPPTSPPIPNGQSPCHPADSAVSSSTSSDLPPKDSTTSSC